MCFAAIDENVATLLDKFRLMAGFAQSLVRLLGNPEFAATVQFAEYYMLLPLILYSNLLPSRDSDSGRRRQRDLYESLLRCPFRLVSTS